MKNLLYRFRYNRLGKLIFFYLLKIYVGIVRRFAKNRFSYLLVKRCAPLKKVFFVAFVNCNVGKDFEIF